MLLNTFLKNKISPDATPNFGYGQSKFKIDYYRQPYFSPEIFTHIQGNL